MGRKGLGKLAGFGVAKTVTVITRRDGERHATKIVLRYDDIVKVAETSKIVIDEEVLPNGGGFTLSGTRVILSDLTYGPTGAQSGTIENRVADHFSQIDPADFKALLNGTEIKSTPRKFVYAWPEPEKPATRLIDTTYQTDDGRTFSYRQRMRFVGDRKALEGKDRGVRVYVNRRLVSAPSLLGADTNMHGFRMTDYLDGVVHADFIDQQQEDYIATDRQSLKWETPLLANLYRDLSETIKRACAERQKVRDEEKDKEVREDKFTKKTIAKAGLNSREKNAALRIGRALASLHKQGTGDEAYRKQFGEVIGAMGRGEILGQLAALAKNPSPEFKQVISEIMRLTAEQRDGFYSYVKGRMDAIKALQKVIDTRDFKSGKNEKELHQLLETNTWLIDPTFFELLTSNRTDKTMYQELEKELKINDDVPDDYDPTTGNESEPGGKNKRPDLVFVLGDTSCSQIVIVELKAPNTPLLGEHYRQLQGYIRDTKKWLERQYRKAQISGIRIGSVGPLKSQAADIEWLEDVIQKSGNTGIIRVIKYARNLYTRSLDFTRLSFTEFISAQCKGFI